jgi:hypothetical protein
MLSLMIRHCADVQSTLSLTSIKSEPATAITANDRSWHVPEGWVSIEKGRSLGSS